MFLRITHPSATRHQLVLLQTMLPFDLHVLGMPPAFNLSQDQTLQFNLCASSKLTILFLQYCSHSNSLKRPHSLSSLLLNELAPKACCVFYSFDSPCQTLFNLFLNFLYSHDLDEAFISAHIIVGNILTLSAGFSP